MLCTLKLRKFSALSAYVNFFPLTFAYETLHSNIHLELYLLLEQYRVYYLLLLLDIDCQHLSESPSPFQANVCVYKGPRIARH